MDVKELEKEYKSKKKDLLREYKKVYGEAKAEYCEKREAISADYDARLAAAEAEYLAKTGGKSKKDPPKRGLLEEIGNSVTHGVGAAFAVVAFILLCFASDTPKDYVGASIYFFGMVVMFLVSCIYHAFPHGMAVKRLFRRFDYSCIYLLIGATFAPILLSYVENFTVGLVFLIIQWVVIATGITLVGVFGPSSLRFIHIPLYFILGWCGIFFIPEMIMRGDFLLLGFILGGGVVYSLGIIPFVMKKKAAHFIWHFFVLGGAVVQWVGIYLAIYLA